MAENNFPKLHNASPPGVSGSAPSGASYIVGYPVRPYRKCCLYGIRFDGFDSFLFDPHEY